MQWSSCDSFTVLITKEEIPTTINQFRSDALLRELWLDLANTYRSVPHQLIEYAMDFFYFRVGIRTLAIKYLEDLQMCCTHQELTTDWQQMEAGIVMGCPITLVLFVAAFKIILMGARKMVGRVTLSSGWELLSRMIGYMDDIAIIFDCWRGLMSLWCVLIRSTYDTLPCPQNLR